MTDEWKDNNLSQTGLTHPFFNFSAALVIFQNQRGILSLCIFPLRG